jgi:hypothetical protein
VRLHWGDPTRHLALYVSRLPYWDGGYPPPATPPERYCCSSELVFTGVLDGNNQFAIAFEQTAGGPPSAFDGQPFGTDRPTSTVKRRFLMERI